MKRKSLIALSLAGQRLYRKLQGELGIADEAGHALLQNACEAHDRLREAQALVSSEGVIVRDRFHQPKAHPGLRIESDARRQFIAALAALRMAGHGLSSVPRPPAMGKKAKADKDAHDAAAGTSWGTLLATRDSPQDDGDQEASDDLPSDDSISVIKNKETIP